MSNWDHEVDFLVVGSGGGGMAAAITAKHNGLDTLVIEKSATFGGTTALSGGVIWIPDNHLMSQVNVPDSEEEALAYLDQVVSDDVPRTKLQAYVTNAKKMLKFLEQNSSVKYDAVENYPDYYSELNGGKPGGRSIEPSPFTIRQAGWGLFQDVNSDAVARRSTMAMSVNEANVVFKHGWKSTVIIFKRLLAYWLHIPDRMRKLPNNRLTLGKALVARLRKSLKDFDVPLWLATPAQELLLEDGKAVGLLCEKDGQPFRIKANKGVLFASGGFEQNDEMRQKYHPRPTGSDWTAANRYNSGDGIKIGEHAGAKTDMMSYVWWSPTLKFPDGVVEALIVGKSMPGGIVVGKSGKRFCNEAEPYEDFVKHQYEAHSDENPTIPGYLIFDGRYRREYPLGTVLAPGKFIGDEKSQKLFDSGWIKKADTLEELAEKWGIDAQGLRETANKMKRFAETGKDEDFGRGNTLIDRYYSDHRVGKNPCITAMEEGPFYAVEIWPGDLGTKGGLVTNEYAQVLNVDGQPIEGFYATGNTTASVMGDSYPGAGSTIGPSMTFGYIAANHASDKD